ncbi:hypothetical protein SASPL_137077 [Salvia splendens]|uniref:Uncharacterized protein n=1 Tax=Salvia splendens TaxID=180675 RepID=A0A8X8WSL5_SALSN|nr:hypothetical protein SASPL_137077 [Salvia splendens]
MNRELFRTYGSSLAGLRDLGYDINPDDYHRTEASGLDPDRFGYFNLIEELNKIGIETWSRLTFVNPMTATHVDIKSDKEVM